MRLLLAGVATALLLAPGAAGLTLPTTPPSPTMLAGAGEGQLSITFCTGELAAAFVGQTSSGEGWRITMLQVYPKNVHLVGLLCPALRQLQFFGPWEPDIGG